MHIQANTDYNLQGNFFFDNFIPSLTWLVYLFLMVSGFGMCAGYLNKFQTDSVNLESFYKKRYRKIMPFFGFLLFIAVIVEHDLKAIYEVSVEFFLLHALLPNNAVSVIGVCWTLGVIFLFYLLFPAFSVLLKNRKRAWIAFGISLWVNFVCEQYFFTEYFVTKSFTPRHSFIYCIPLFISGGLIYLYRTEIKCICNRFRWGVLVVCMTATVLWYLTPGTGSVFFYIKSLVLFCLWLSYAIGVDSKFLSSRPLKFLSGISMEMYLAQMVIFRVIERLHLLYICGNNGIGGWISMIIAFNITIAGLILFIQCYKVAYQIVETRWLKRG